MGEQLGETGTVIGQAVAPPSGRAAVPATCGELVQGTLDGVPCLVSCPIDIYSVAEVRLLCLPVPQAASQTGSASPGRQCWQVPADRPKAVAALRAGLRHLGHESGTWLRLSSPLPPGRGYGSSTADVGATLYALGRACGRDILPAEAARLAVSIEPSDSSLFPGLTLFAHRSAGFHETLGWAPPLRLIVIDPGGEVDTLAFNDIDHKEALRRLALGHREAFELLRHSLRQSDWHGLGGAATLSASLHQTILHNPWLEQVLALAGQVGALGVCRAHSGTLLGILLDPAADVASSAAYVARRLPPEMAVHTHRLVGGGPLDEDEADVWQEKLPIAARRERDACIP
jgi:L-threonine kinase